MYAEDDGTTKGLSINSVNLMEQKDSDSCHCRFPVQLETLDIKIHRSQGKKDSILQALTAIRL